jgi:hypothetical protein
MFLKKLPLYLLLPVLLLLSSTTIAHTKSLKITSFGAIADGITNNAVAIQKAIDKVAKSGGGKVIVPPGNFMAGTIWLKSGVTLHLELGARLLGPTDRNLFAVVPDRPAVVMAENQHHIGISGQGIIDGQGQELMLDIFKKLRSGEMVQDTIWKVKRPGGRAMVLNFKSCSDISISGVTLKNASDWVQDYRECSNLIIDGITVQSTAYWNNDGLDITDSKNVRISNCFINSTDDAICLKSENPALGCENVQIENCTLRSSANALKFGTRSDGGFRKVTVRNLTIFDTYRSAIALESVDGGDLTGIDIQHINAKNTGNAIFIRLGQRTDGKASTLKGVYIAHVKVEVPLYKPDQGYPIEGPPDHLRPGEDKMPKRPSHFHIYGHPFLPYNLIPSSIVGLPGHPVQDVTLEDIEITYGGRAKKEIAHIPLDKITTIPENPKAYPDFSMFGELPAWGFYMRHAEGVKIKGMKLRYVDDDFRPALVLDDVKNSEFDGVEVLTAKEMPVVVLNNTSGIVTKNLKLPVGEEKGVVRSAYK